MALLVKLSSTLRRLAPGYDPEQGLRLEARKNERVADLLDRLGIPRDRVKVIMVNGVHALPETLLEDGDRVGLFPPVGGG